MRIVLDSNVLMSGIFFGGTPGQIVDAWKERRIAVPSLRAFSMKYRRVAEELDAKYGDFGLSSILTIIVANSEIVDAPDLELIRELCEL